MSDTPPEGRTDSKLNLIEVHHVGVTAKLQSPLKNLMNSYCSSTETEGDDGVYHGKHKHSNSKYMKLNNDKVTIETESETVATTQSDQPPKVLYEMRALQSNKSKVKELRNITPSKFEFQLYTKRPYGQRKRHRKIQGKSRTRSILRNKKKSSQRRLFCKDEEDPGNAKQPKSVFKRLRESLRQLRLNSAMDRPSVDKIFDEFPEPATGYQPLKELRIGIYPFDHGCPDYLKTHDAPPQIISIYLAERAIYYATRFWGEFFGSIHIGVAFVITFVLQTYRFLLYCLINTLLVGFLHMTSDYFIKPLLTVLFNGFLQPLMTFCLNILSSVRDVLRPIAEIIDHFMKPIATVGKSVRLVHATYNKRYITKCV